jgi:hypothetical protein
MIHSRWIVTLLLAMVTLLLLSCLFPLLGLPTTSSDQGVLDVDIHYVGSWYRETFDYSRGAANIRHLVLVLPEDRAVGVDPGWIFTGLTFQAGRLAVADDRQEYAWALDYLYQAPQGYFTGEFDPGTYAVAVAFIAAPLSREEAGMGEDVVLWPGVTGGGASTGYKRVTLEAGETTAVTFRVEDDDGWG